SLSGAPKFAALSRGRFVEGLLRATQLLRRDRARGIRDTGGRFVKGRLLLLLPDRHPGLQRERRRKFHRAGACLPGVLRFVVLREAAAEFGGWDSGRSGSSGR